VADIALSILFHGLASAMVLYIIAVGLSVTMGLMGFVNLAHGVFAMAGGYVAAALVNRMGVSFFAAASHGHLKKDFPRSLHGAPMLMPSEASAVRHALDLWFDGKGVRPTVVGDFDDSALLKAFGQRGLGVFAMPSVIEAEVVRQFDVNVIGRTDEIENCFYAITVERRLRHPAVVAIAQAARSDMFHQ